MRRYLPVLFEDNHLLVVNKPAGMLSQADLGGDLDVLTAARQMIKERDGKPGNVYLGLVHRLDRPVGGVMVVAKTSKAAGRLSAQFRSRETTKIYLAVVEGRPEPEERRLVHWLEKDRASRTTRVVGESRGGKRAELEYRVLEQRGRKSLLQVTLLTGLPHQIRAQLSAVGHPILWDRKYGATPASERGRIALFSRSMTIAHPVGKRTMTFTAEPPPPWPWP